MPTAFSMPLLELGKFVFLQRIFTWSLPQKIVQSVPKRNEFSISHAVVTNFCIFFTRGMRIHWSNHAWQRWMHTPMQKRRAHAVPALCAHIILVCFSIIGKWFDHVTIQMFLRSTGSKSWTATFSRHTPNMVTWWIDLPQLSSYIHLPGITVNLQGIPILTVATNTSAWQDIQPLGWLWTDLVRLRIFKKNR